MVRVIVKSLKSRNRGKTSVGKKRVRDTAGQSKTLRTLDVGSRTFGGDLRYVFDRNVAKARRDNKRVIGIADVVVAKR